MGVARISWELRVDKANVDDARAETWLESANRRAPCGLGN